MLERCLCCYGVKKRAPRSSSVIHCYITHVIWSKLVWHHSRVNLLWTKCKRKQDELIPRAAIRWIMLNHYGGGSGTSRLTYDCSSRFECDIEFGLDSTLSFSFMFGPSTSSLYPKHIIFRPSALRWSSDRVEENSVQTIQVARYPTGDGCGTLQPPLVFHKNSLSLCILVYVRFLHFNWYINFIIYA